jgi:hypothetical protein
MYEESVRSRNLRVFFRLCPNAEGNAQKPESAMFTSLVEKIRIQ